MIDITDRIVKLIEGEPVDERYPWGDYFSSAICVTKANPPIEYFDYCLSRLRHEVDDRVEGWCVSAWKLTDPDHRDLIRIYRPQPKYEMREDFNGLRMMLVQEPVTFWCEYRIWPRRF